MYISVCIGSACHIKGSYEVIRKMKEYIETNSLEEELELKSAFCLGKCSNAVSVSVNGERIESIAPEDVENFMRNLTKKG